MATQGWWRRACATLAVGCAALALGACGSGSDDGSKATATSGGSGTTTIDVGTGTPIGVATSRPRIAWFGALGAAYVQAQAQGMKDEAAKDGLDLTIFDSKLDPLVQLQQVQNALQQHKFDAFVVDPFDGNAECPVLSREAPSKGVVVVTAAVTMCNHVKVDEGPDSWAPGTLAQVGNQNGLNVMRQYLDEVDRRRDDGARHVGLLLVGPALNPSTIATTEALKQARAEGALRNVDVKYVVNTDFTTPDGLARTQTLLQAHPEIDTILSQYSDITLGAIAAVKKAGLSGKIKIYDQGASRQSVEAVKAGDLEITTAYHPYRIGVDSIKAVADAFAGKQVPRFIAAGVPGESLGKHLIVDKTNVATFRPEY
jgi:ribose transport system substrate-binding protein